MSEVLFADAISKSKEIVNILKKEENVDLIVCLSHSGTWDKQSDSEDEILAKEVPGIDVIISGHTHTALEKPIIVENTIIASYGRYGENLGKLRITQNSNNKWDLNIYELKRIDDSLEMDSEISQTVDSFRDIVQEQYLDNFNMKFDDVLAHVSFSFTESSMLGEEHREEPLGSLIRDSFVEGDITTSQVFNVSSLGIGPYKVSGYPLITSIFNRKGVKSNSRG